MKILHIINSLGSGGAESLLSDLCLIQKSQGLDVTIAVLKESKSIFEDKVEKLGYHLIKLSKNASVYNPIFIIKVSKLIKQYDLVHVHLFPTQYWVAIAKLLTNAKTPIITTEHSTFNRRRNYAIFKLFDSFIYKLYGKVVCCSDKAYETFMVHFSGMTNVVSIPNGINLERLKNAKAQDKQEIFNVPSSSCVVTMVARFQHPKRQDHLIRVLKYLPENYYVVLVGNKPEDTNIKAITDLTKELDVESRVRMLGVRNDVPDILKSSDIIVLASDYEGLSLSSIEGMAVKKPFIATNVNGLREVVSNAGVLYENDNIKMLAKCILELTQDKKYYEIISERCYIRASEYDINKMANLYLKIYKELAE